ncbi:hypothetical protein P7K49_003241, partial [Saguinus oedipus]
GSSAEMQKASRGPTQGIWGLLGSAQNQQKLELVVKSRRQLIPLGQPQPQSLLWGPVAGGLESGMHLLD